MNSESTDLTAALRKLRDGTERCTNRAIAEFQTTIDVLSKDCLPANQREVCDKSQIAWQELQLMVLPGEAVRPASTLIQTHGDDFASISLFIDLSNQALGLLPPDYSRRSAVKQRLEWARIFRDEGPDALRAVLAHNASAILAEVKDIQSGAPELGAEEGRG